MGAPQLSCHVLLTGEILWRTKMLRGGSCGHLVLNLLDAGISAESALPGSGCPGCSIPCHWLSWPAQPPLPGGAVCPARLLLSSPGQSRVWSGPCVSPGPLEFGEDIFHQGRQLVVVR